VPALWAVFLDLMREPRDGQRLQPDASRTGEHREEQPVAAENQVLIPRTMVIWKDTLA